MSASARGPATIGIVVAAVLIIAGVVLWFTAPGGPASFGWFAYAPLSDEVFTGPLMLFGQGLLAAVLVAAGLVIAGVALGFWWGRRVGRIDVHPGAE